MIDVAKGKKSSCLALKISKKLWKKLIILSNNEKTLRDYPVQSEQTHQWTHSQHKKERNDQLNIIE